MPNVRLSLNYAGEVYEYQPCPLCGRPGADSRGWLVCVEATRQGVCDACAGPDGPELLAARPDGRAIDFRPGESFFTDDARLLGAAYRRVAWCDPERDGKAQSVRHEAAIDPFG